MNNHPLSDERVDEARDENAATYEDCSLCRFPVDTEHMIRCSCGSWTCTDCHDGSSGKCGAQQCDRLARGE